MKLDRRRPGALFAAAVLSLPGAPAPAAELGIRGTRFTLDRKDTFLLGMSYYGALGAPEEFVRKDLDDLEAAGFNWIRVWATWAAFENEVSAVDPASGGPREPFLGKLKSLVAECDRRGMVVNVTLSRGNGATGPPRLKTLEAHRRAVETLVGALRDRRNWYLDLADEHNLRDQRFTGAGDLKDLRALARKLDGKLLVTASRVEDPGREELLDDLAVAGLDFVSVHRRREKGSPAETESKARECRERMREIGLPSPLHYDEPFRRGFARWEPEGADFLADLRGALAGGAAGWCLHNGHTRDARGGHPRRSFDLREKRLLDQLDAEEKQALAGARKLVAEASARRPGG